MNYESIKGSVAVLISGGVDSAVVVHQLCEAGLKPDLHYIKIGMDREDSSCTAEEDIELSEATARKYGLKLEVTDLQKEYWEQVVGYAIERIKQGLTPNPDVMCNRLIKFGAQPKTQSRTKRTSWRSSATNSSVIHSSPSVT